MSFLAQFVTFLTLAHLPPSRISSSDTSLRAIKASARYQLSIINFQFSIVSRCFYPRSTLAVPSQRPSFPPMFSTVTLPSHYRLTLFLFSLPACTKNGTRTLRMPFPEISVSLCLFLYRAVVGDGVCPQCGGEAQRVRRYSPFQGCGFVAVVGLASGSGDDVLPAEAY